MTQEPDIKRRTAKRKAELIKQICGGGLFQPVKIQPQQQKQKNRNSYYVTS